MTTLGDMVTILSQRSGNRDDLESRIKSEQRFVQKTILEGTGAFKPWFLESDPELLTTTANSPIVAFPDDYLGEIENSMLWYQDDAGTWHKLEKKSYDYVVGRTAIEEGVPKYFVIAATSFYIYPIPSKAYSLRFRYYQKEPELVNDTDTNLWLFHAEDLFFAEVGAIINEFHTKDDNQAAKFRQAATVARQRLFVLNAAKENVNRDYEMGT